MRILLYVSTEAEFRVFAPKVAELAATVCDAIQRIAPELRFAPTRNCAAVMKSGSMRFSRAASPIHCNTAKQKKLSFRMLSKSDDLPRESARRTATPPLSNSAGTQI